MRVGASGGGAARSVSLSPQDARLVEALRAGDERAFAELVDLYCGSMLRVARDYVGGGAVAEEVVQEAWLGVVRELGGFVGRSSLRTCGAGTAILELARAFPASRFVGYDAFEGQIELARAAADEAGVGERVRFELADGSEPLPGRYDLITAFDVVPRRGRPARAAALDQGGAPDRRRVPDARDERVQPARGECRPDRHVHVRVQPPLLPDDVAPHHGAGLGTCGVHEEKARELAAAAGFSSVHRLPIEDPFSVLDELRP